MRQFVASPRQKACGNAEAGFEVIVRDGSMLANAAQSDGVPIEERVASQVRALETWYAAEFERRLAALTEILKTQLQIQIEELQQHYERRERTIQEKAQASTAGYKTAPSAALNGAHEPEKLLEEIHRAETTVHKCASELERMVADDSVNLGVLLQMRNQQLEVRAYLRGLKFGSESGQATS